MSRQFVNLDNPGGKRRIIAVRIHREVDTSPDLSFIGEYKSYSKLTPEEADKAIDREERGDMGRNEYRFFVPAMTGEQTGNPESPEQDYQRMESYNRGNWCMLGVWAEAEIQLGGTVTQTIRSGGLWGIESDGDSPYFAEVEKDELSALRDELVAVGFTKRAITLAFKDAEVVTV